MDVLNYVLNFRITPIISIILAVIIALTLTILFRLLRTRNITANDRYWKAKFIEEQKTCPYCNEYDKFKILPRSTKDLQKMRCEICSTEWSIWPMKKTDTTPLVNRNLDTRRIDFIPRRPENR